MYAGESLPDRGHPTAMDGRFSGVSIVPLTISIAGISVLTLNLLLLHLPLRSSDTHSFRDSCDCRHQHEWQLDLMNKTFHTSLAIYEEKIKNLHHSDMNMAEIREQLHQEILELFLYEYQTMNHRLKSIRTDSVPQFCSNWCTNMGSSKCNESIDNQRLLEREHQLKLRLQRQQELSQSQICFDQNKLAAGSTLVALLIILFGIISALLWIKHMRKYWDLKQKNISS
jgi:hypothetical protein